MDHKDPRSFSAQPTIVPGSNDSIPPALKASTEYEVIREINRGAMGVVYLVRNRRMDRLEGLKVIQEAILKRAGILERFEREMRSAARLNHTNIVTAFASPPLPGLLAFAMEFVDGTDLASLVRVHGPLPVSNACCYIHQVAQGLQHAHEEGLVHRDIKPSNLILKCTGDRQIVKILDFGLAKATSENRTDGGLTGTGQMMGTPHYVAPEQIANAAKADIRADIYSLGCTLYHLLSGHPPFKRHEGLYGILHAHTTETAPLLNQLRQEVPADLATIVAKMIAKDPADRFQKPADVMQTLAPFFSEGIKPVPPGDAQFLQAAAVDSESDQWVETDMARPSAAVPLDGNAAINATRTVAEFVQPPPVTTQIESRRPNSVVHETFCGSKSFVVIERIGMQHNLSDLSINYPDLGPYREKKGIKLRRGSAETLVEWTNIDTLTFSDPRKDKCGNNCYDVQVILRDGKHLTLELGIHFHMSGAYEFLFGHCDIGEIKIKFSDIATITCPRDQ